MKTFTKSIIAALTASLLSASSFAGTQAEEVLIAEKLRAPTVQVQAAKFENLSILEKAQYRRATEAVVWSMNMMNIEAMRSGLFALDNANYNTVFFNSQIQDWKLQTTTTNNTTPYVMAFWNVEESPVVVEVPKSGGTVNLFGTLMDMQHKPLEDVGAKGYDRGHGAKYLIISESYQGAIPRGYRVLVQKSNVGYALIRPIIRGETPENLAAAAEVAQNIKIYPLDKPEQVGSHVDMFNKHVDGIPHFDARFFSELNDVVQREVIQPEDKSMYGLLNEIGIKKGAEFKPTARQQQIFELAANEAHEYLKELYFNSGITASFYPDPSNQWQFIATAETVESDFTYDFNTHIDIDSRAATFYALYSSAKNWNFHDAATFYLGSNRDADNDQLNGSQTYTLTVPKDAPIKHFWSAITYDMNDATWMDGLPKVGVASTDSGIVVNKDGSVTLTFSPNLPAGVNEANWVPTAEGVDYFVYFRTYGPTPEFFAKMWVIDSIQKAK
ncbi:DUF1214 domain-containing protein [Thalassotalea psychrophila]|uniref:DUF1214 domain-containing protein n=1 Tax=Thalassotalea psychrophila TaxID=3065647 RepID=A0ABY9TZE3_9GAMM|nr:DUF1214 domain-containing protein [Colwelliaceae bacterium SQ149]